MPESRLAVVTKFLYYLFWTCMSEIRDREFRLYISLKGLFPLVGLRLNPRESTRTMLHFSRTAWGIPESDVTHMGFVVYRHVFCKFVTYSHLVICQYGKQNPIFNTIKELGQTPVCTTKRTRYTTTRSGQDMCGRKILRS